ncbi:hypothetical protein SAMN06272789_6677, partial [Streptomyces sp. 1331.2]
MYVNGPNNRLNSLDFSTGKWTEFILTPAGTAWPPTPSRRPSWTR